MKSLFSISLAFFLIGSASAQDACQSVAGASFIADDGTFLGTATSKYDSDSILNEYGNHGSKYATESIWNEYGTYGGKYSTQSPFNPYSSTPPLIVRSGTVIGRLTVNRSAGNALNPHFLKTCDFY